MLQWKEPLWLCVTAGPSPHLCVTWLWPWSSVSAHPECLDASALALELLHCNWLAFLPRLVLLLPCPVFSVPFQRWPLNVNVDILKPSTRFWLKHGLVISTAILPHLSSLSSAYTFFPNPFRSVKQAHGHVRLSSSEFEGKYWVGRKPLGAPLFDAVSLSVKQDWWNVMFGLGPTFGFAVWCWEKALSKELRLSLSLTFSLTPHASGCNYSRLQLSGWAERRAPGFALLFKYAWDCVLVNGHITTPPNKCVGIFISSVSTFPTDWCKMRTVRGQFCINSKKKIIIKNSRPQAFFSTRNKVLE